MLNFIHNNSNKNLVLFIHGFTGDEDTWKNSKDDYFPKMLLSIKDIENNYDIAYFTYYSKLFNIPGKAVSNILLNKLFNKNRKNRKNLNIDELANYLGSTIRIECNSYENIIIIAHSMGGLIAKATILNDITDFQFTKVKLFISLAVPHSGSNLANLAKYTQNVQANDLVPLNDTIARLTQRWINSEHPESIYFIAQHDDIVQKNSAIPFDKDPIEKIYCDDDHISISKPESCNELVFKAVQKLLLDFIYNTTVIESLAIRSPNNINCFDDELFVIKLIIADVHDVQINDAKINFYNAEYMTRTLNKHQLKYLDDLYLKIKHLYTIFFSKLINGTFKNSNQLITEIHDEIRKDPTLNITSDGYKDLFKLINHIHKTGMLHQLANKKDQDIFWKDNCIKEIDNYIESRKKHE